MGRLIPSLLLLFLLDSPALRATVDCPKIAAPGRVRCGLAENVDAPARIAWADVEVVRAPPFLVALKGRIGPGDATAKGDQSWRFGFALVAREVGEGDVSLRARAVVCDGQGHCAPRELDVVAHVTVGR
jgi:hypothetical protein